jgi:hypothetical protein
VLGVTCTYGGGSLCKCERHAKERWRVVDGAYVTFLGKFSHWAFARAFGRNQGRLSYGEALR